MNANVPATIFTADPTAVLTTVDEEGKLVAYEGLLATINAERAAFVPDLSTDLSRKKISSFAFKITRTKTAVDDAGKALNEEARKKIAAVQEVRNKVVGELEAIAKAVRQPLTEWEEAEKTRVEKVRAIIDGFKAANALASDSPAMIQAKIDAISSVEVDADMFGDELSGAIAHRDAALAHLRAAHSAAAQAEADRAELERLRAVNAENERREEERLAAEAAEAARIEAERLAAERAAQAEADAVRRAEEAAAAARAEEQRLAQKAIDEAAQQAAAARAEEQRIAQQAIDEANKRAADAEAAAKAERDRIAAAAKRAADEQAARDADVAHRGKIMGAAKAALMQFGPDEETAKKIVLAIAAGEIPNVTLRF